MGSGNQDPTISPTPDNALLGLRELSIQCRGLLHELSADDGEDRGAETKELKASFNIWTANMGVFREGQQSLASRLKNTPQISGLVQQLLTTLKDELEKSLLSVDDQEETCSASESDDSMSSDRSSVSYRLLSKSDDDEVPPSPASRPAVWASIDDTITSLRQLEMTVRLAGAQHRQERIRRFTNLDHNRQVHQLFERCARQKADYLFPRASRILRERVAESIATRRMRFRYLELHQKKTSTLNEPAPAPQPSGAPGAQEETLLPDFEPAAQREARGPPIERGNLDPGGSVVSNTVVTKLDPKQLHQARNSAKRSESVTSVKISSGKFPSKPKLDPGGASFACPYCFLVCPAKEASGQIQWMNHLIHDFEPFFCVFDNCSSPFVCADTYTGWLAHMRTTHTQPKWHCWHCDATSSPNSSFPAPEQLERHLEEHHQNEIAGPLRSVLVKHSMIRDQHALQECPFCAGFPEEIEKHHPNRDGRPAREALEKHVRDHLISVALILAPVETEEHDGKADDTDSEAQRGNDSECDLNLDGVGDAHEPECRRDSCDCKDDKSSDILGPSAGSGQVGSDIEDVQAHSRLAQLWQEILDDKTSRAREDETLASFAANFGARSSPMTPSPPPASSLPGVDEVSMFGGTYSHAILKHLARVYNDLRPSSFSKSGPSYVSRDALGAFLTSVQGETGVWESLPGDKKTYTEPEFLEFWLKTYGLVAIRTLESERKDLNWPLPNYFISSSHSMYLARHQHEYRFFPGAYRMFLRGGCRCIEINVWNGGAVTPAAHGQPLPYPTDEPIVIDDLGRKYPCGFREVCQAIGENAFETNDLAVIVSLEVHADIEQQNVMVKIMKEEWGEMLLDKPIEGIDPRFRLPTLGDVKRKIMVKVKKAPNIPQMPLDPGTLSPAFQNNDNRPSKQSPGDGQTSPPAATTLDPENKRTNPPKNTEVNIAAALSDLAIYTFSEHFEGFDTPAAQQPGHIFSLSTNCFYGLAARHAREMFTHNKRHFMCAFPTFPYGVQVRSNSDPSPFWRKGVQMVALNWQYLDEGIMLNEAMFSDEQGWALKPAGYRSADGRTETEADAAPRRSLELAVTLLAGQGIRASYSYGDYRYGKSGKSLRPFVRCELHVEKRLADGRDAKGAAFKLDTAPSSDETGGMAEWDSGASLKFPKSRGWLRS